MYFELDDTNTQNRTNRTLLYTELATSRQLEMTINSLNCVERTWLRSVFGWFLGGLCHFFCAVAFLYFSNFQNHQLLVFRGPRVDLRRYFYFFFALAMKLTPFEEFTDHFQYSNFNIHCFIHVLNLGGGGEFHHPLRDE